MDRGRAGARRGRHRGPAEHLVKEAGLGSAEPAGSSWTASPATSTRPRRWWRCSAPRASTWSSTSTSSTEEVLRRLAGRRVCPNCGSNYNVVDNPPKVAGICDVCGGELVQRDDDTEEAIRRRLEIYESETAPLIDWYAEQGLLATVDAVGSPDEVTDRAVKAVEAARARTAFGQPDRSGPDTRVHEWSPVAWGHEATARRDRQDAQGRPGGGRDARGDLGRGAPGRDHRAAGQAGP